PRNGKLHCARSHYARMDVVLRGRYPPVLHGNSGGQPRLPMDRFSRTTQMVLAPREGISDPCDVRHNQLHCLSSRANRSNPRGGVVYVPLFVNQGRCCCDGCCMTALVLALDLATRTGWAIGEPGKTPVSG